MSLKWLRRFAPAALVCGLAAVASAQDSVQISDAAVGSATVSEAAANVDDVTAVKTVALVGDGKDASCEAKESGCGCGGTSCGGGCGDACKAWELFPERNGHKIGGWVQSGYHNKSTGLFNKHPGRFNVHQAWFYAEKVADGKCGWDWGYRGDVVYGVDAQDTQAFGNTPGKWDYQNGLDHGIYGWAIPQAFVELANGPLNIKAGHFFTTIGYEVVPATGNFFYSHSFTMNNSEPFTHTGVLGSYKVGEGITGYFGWTLGWDTGFDQTNQGNNYIGGMSVALGEDITFTYMSTVGNFGTRSAGTDGYMHSVVVDLTLTERLNYVFQTDFLDTDNGEDDIGINQYLFYTLNDCWKFGTRIEWWRDDGTSHYQATGGVNWIPCENFRLRPEVRQQWIPAQDFDETIFGVDAIFTF